VSEGVVSQEDKLRDYELVFIVSPEVAEDRLDATIETVSQWVTSKGGVVSQVERWGKRRLAYPIRHFAEGNYVLFRLKLDPGRNQELDTSLKISEEILRHLLVRMN